MSIQMVDDDEVKAQEGDFCKYYRHYRSSHTSQQLTMRCVEYEQTDRGSHRKSLAEIEVLKEVSHGLDLSTTHSINNQSGAERV